MKDSWSDDNIFIDKDRKEKAQFYHDFQSCLKASLQHFFENYNEHSQSIESSLNADVSFRQLVVKFQGNEHDVEGWADVIGQGARLANQHMNNPALASKAAMSGVLTFLCSKFPFAYSGTANMLHSEVTSSGIQGSHNTEWLLPPKIHLSEQDKKLDIDLLTLVGVAGHDRIMGTEQDDKLFGDGGNDLLNGVDGNDILYGG